MSNTIPSDAFFVDQDEHVYIDPVTGTRRLVLSAVNQLANRAHEVAWQLRDVEQEMELTRHQRQFLEEVEAILAQEHEEQEEMLREAAAADFEHQLAEGEAALLQSYEEVMAEFDHTAVPRQLESSVDSCSSGSITASESEWGSEETSSTSTDGCPEVIDLTIEEPATSASLDTQEPPAKRQCIDLTMD